MVHPEAPRWPRPRCPACRRWLGWDAAGPAAYDDASPRAPAGRLAELAAAPAEPARVTRTDRAGADVLTAGRPGPGHLGRRPASPPAPATREAAPTTGDFVRLQHWAGRPGHRRGGAAAAYGDRPGQRVAARRTARCSPPTSTPSPSSSRSYPEPQVARIERLLALAWDSGAAAAPRAHQGRPVLGRRRGRPPSSASRSRPACRCTSWSRPTGHGLDELPGLLRRRARPWPWSAAPEPASRRCSTPWSGAELMAHQRARDVRQGAAHDGHPRAAPQRRAAARSSTRPGCAASACSTPGAWRRSSPRSRSWRAVPVRRLRATRPSPGAPCWRRSRRASCPSAGWRSWRKLQREAAVGRLAHGRPAAQGPRAGVEVINKAVRAGRDPALIGALPGPVGDRVGPVDSRIG